MENCLPKHMYSAGQSVKLIVCLQGPDAQDSMNSSPENASRQVSEFYVSTALLRNASPVFASMLDGPWKESGEVAITIHNFEIDAFCVFLDCLHHLANETARSGDTLIFTASVIRKVLPIAHFFQVDALKKQIISTVMEIMKQCQDSKATELRFIKAADLLFAVEANLPETEIPDWPERTLQQAIRLMLDCSAADDANDLECGGRISIVSGLEITTYIKYKPNGGIDDLCKKTLKKCVQSLSLEIKCNISGDDWEQSADRAAQAMRWPELFTEVL
jgi:hypothetical protein